MDTHPRFPPRPISDKRIVCIISATQRGQLPEGPCTGQHNHAHYTRNRVAKLINEGRMQWDGESKRVAYWPVRPVEWRKVKGQTGRPGSFVGAMQLKRGGEKRYPRMVPGGLVSPR